MFTPAQFRLDYPQFASLTDLQINNAYQTARLIAKFTPILGSTESEVDFLWELVVAHILTTSNTAGSNTGTGVVGRVSSATEGSVSSAISYNTYMSGEYWSQSQYGAQFYQIMLSNGGFYYVQPDCNYEGDGVIYY